MTGQAFKLEMRYTLLKQDKSSYQKCTVLNLISGNSVQLEAANSFPTTGQDIKNVLSNTTLMWISKNVYVKPLFLVFKYHNLQLLSSIKKDSKIVSQDLSLTILVKEYCTCNQTTTHENISSSCIKHFLPVSFSWLCC